MFHVKLLRFITGCIFNVLLLGGFLCAADLEGWYSIKTIPSSYWNMPTQNVLRCGKLCERQGKCVAATFDNRGRVCYLHAANTAIPTIKSGERYLFKEYQKNGAQHPNSESECDKETKIALPAVRDKNEHCYDMKALGLIGHSCAAPVDCVVQASECRSEGICGCRAGYSFQPETETCEAACSKYGNTFQIFKLRCITGFNVEIHENKSPNECAQLCIDAGFTCVSFDQNISNNRCFLQAVDALDEPTVYVADTKYDHYQRNCA